jgi:hypothetical protein
VAGYGDESGVHPHRLHEGAVEDGQVVAVPAAEHQGLVGVLEEVHGHGVAGVVHVGGVGIYDVVDAVGPQGLEDAHGHLDIAVDEGAYALGGDGRGVLGEPQGGRILGGAKGGRAPVVVPGHGVAVVDGQAQGDLGPAVLAYQAVLQDEGGLAFHPLGQGEDELLEEGLEGHLGAGAGGQRGDRAAELGLLHVEGHDEGDPQVGDGVGLGVGHPDRAEFVFVVVGVEDREDRVAAQELGPHPLAATEHLEDV